MARALPTNTPGGPPGAARPPPRGEGVASGRPERQQKRDRTPERGRKVSHHGEARAAHAGASADTTPQAPGGFPPPRRGAHATRAARARDGRRVKPPPDGRRDRGTGGGGAAPAGGRSPRGRRGRGRAPPDGTPPRAHHRPRPAGGRAIPQGVFKPPRRNALGTWTAGADEEGGTGVRPPTLETP